MHLSCLTILLDTNCQSFTPRIFGSVVLWWVLNFCFYEVYIIQNALDLEGLCFDNPVLHFYRLFDISINVFNMKTKIKPKVLKAFQCYLEGIFWCVSFLSYKSGTFWLITLTKWLTWSLISGCLLGHKYESF